MSALLVGLAAVSSMEAVKMTVAGGALAVSVFTAATKGRGKGKKEVRDVTPLKKARQHSA